MNRKTAAVFFAFLLTCTLLCGSALASGDPVVDAYTSASATRTLLQGDTLDAAVDDLIAISNDLATKSDAEAKGSGEMSNSALAQVLTVNPDGSVGISTIHAWQVTRGEDGAIYVTVVMTDGQNIRNLAEVGDRGTILVHGDAYYLMHVETEEVTELPYSDEAYEAGLFNEDYSGAAEQRSEYTVTFRVYEIESSFVYMFE